MNAKNFPEAIKYLIAGGGAVFTDFTAYYALLYFGAVPSLAKSVSFMSGSVLSYLLNKFWTFQAKRYSFYEVLKFAALYFSTLATNVLLNKSILSLNSDGVFLAFCIATGTTIALNFLGQKFWVFKAKSMFEV